jgi:glycosyltransferase involved in cell wall biosynthesis
MSEFEKNVTFVIVCFRSRNIIEKCLESISSNCKVIIVENSNDILIKDYLEKKF